jgi:hypothetical protein
MNYIELYKNFLIGFSIFLIILYAAHLVRHYTVKNKECTILKGQCPENKYCGINGTCVEGNENESCFLGLAQCKRPFNCYPDFKCHKF